VTNDPNWQGFTNLQPEDIEMLLSVARANDWMRAALHTLARRGVALRQQHADRAFELLQILSPHPFYKAGQFLFDLLEWEDFIVDGPPPDSIDTILNTESLHAVSGVFRGLKGYLDGALPRDMSIMTSFDPMTFVSLEEDLPPLEPGFYLYQDIVLGLLRTVVQRRPICLMIDRAQLGESNTLLMPYRSGGFELIAPGIDQLICVLDEQRNRVTLLLPNDELRVLLPDGARLVVVNVMHRHPGSLIIRAYNQNAQLLVERALQAEDQVQEIMLEYAAAYITLQGDSSAELLGVCVYRFVGGG
jgi:hypothetical protein